MAYSRQPQVVIANGGALKQTPVSTVTQPPGIVPVELEAKIATTSSLGVVEIGSGLSITPQGVLSANNSGGDCCKIISVKLVDDDYSITNNDYFIGATEKNITLTLPLGILGRVYYIKNEINGNIKIKGTSGQTIDGSILSTLGSNAGIIVVFDGTRWNIL